MFNLNNALKDAQVYSVEYCGFFIVKFSIQSQLDFSKHINDISIELISGFKIVNFNNKFSINDCMFNLYGETIINASLTIENDLELEFSNDSKIKSICDNHPLGDRDWVIEDTSDKNSYILNNAGELYYSDNMKILIDKNGNVRN